MIGERARGSGDGERRPAPASATIIARVGLFAFALAAQASARADDAPPRPEPIPHRLQSAVLRTVPLFAPAAAATLPPGEWALESTPGFAVTQLGETGDPGSRTDVAVSATTWSVPATLRAGVAEGFELGIGWEWMGWGENPKEHDGTQALIRYDGTILTALDRATDGPGDLRLGIRWQPLFPEFGLFALRAEWSLPTGDPDEGTGLGRHALAVGAIASAQVVDDLWVDLSAGVTYAARPHGRTGGRLRLDPVWHGAAVVNLDVGRGVAWHLQITWAENPFPHSGAGKLDADAAEIGLAVSWRPAPTLRVALVFAEEMTRLAPDFSVGAAIEWRFPGP